MKDWIKGLIIVATVAFLLVLYGTLIYGSRPKLHLVETRDLPLAAPTSSVATQNALKATWASVKEDYGVKSNKIDSADEFSQRNFPFQALLLGSGNAPDEVSAFYLGAQSLGENGVPSEIFVYRKGLRRALFDVRYQVGTVTLGADGKSVLVGSRQATAGTVIWYVVAGIVSAVVVIGWAFTLMIVFDLIGSLGNYTRAVWYRLRS